MSLLLLMVLLFNERLKMKYIYTSFLQRVMAHKTSLTQQPVLVSVSSQGCFVFFYLSTIFIGFWNRSATVVFFVFSFYYQIVTHQCFTFYSVVMFSCPGAIPIQPSQSMIKIAEPGTNCKRFISVVLVILLHK